MLSQKVLNKSQAFHFRSTVHTNTTPTGLHEKQVPRDKQVPREKQIPNGIT